MSRRQFISSLLLHLIHYNLIHYNFQGETRTSSVHCFAQGCTWTGGSPNDRHRRGYSFRINDGKPDNQDIPCIQSSLTHVISCQLQKGASSARSDDTKSLKSAIVDWLSPPNEPLIPPIARNVKVDRGFNHQVTGALLCPVGVDWSDKA